MPRSLAVGTSMFFTPAPARITRLRALPASNAALLTSVPRTTSTLIPASRPGSSVASSSGS